jgi:hypothetical protein
MKRLFTLTTVFAALAILTGAAAHAADTYVDTVGDNKTAPDIRQVSLTDAGNGTIHVAIDLDAEIAAGSSLVMGIDADRDASTGAHCGCDYMVFADDEGLSLGKWIETQWADFPRQPLDPEEDGGRLTFTLTLADLGGTRAFDYWVATYRGDDSDYAPEGDDVYTFPQGAERPEIRSVLVNATALLPKAGKVLTIAPPQLVLTTRKVVPADSMTCSLTYKGTILAARGSCTWRIPVALRRKNLVLSITVTYQGATRSLTLPVRPR